MASSALVKAREHLMRMRSHVTNIKARGEEAVGEGLATVEVFGGSVAGGFLDEKMGQDEGDGIKVHRLHNIPTNLILGASAKAAAFLGAAGKHGKHVHDIGNGLLAAYGTTLGRSLAKKTETVK
jgi:hypothetical protein